MSKSHRRFGISIADGCVERSTFYPFELKSSSKKGPELITVTIRTILDFKRILGKREVEISVPEQSTLQGLLLKMVDTWGEGLRSQLFEPNSTSPLSYIRLMVNGQDIAFLNGMETVLEDGDEILILPPVGGG